MARLLLVDCLILLLMAPSVFPLKCFTNLHFPDVKPCITVQGRDHKEGIADVFLNVVNLGIDVFQTLTNTQIIDDIADNIFQMTRINIRSREANRPWVKQVLGILNFGDPSHHCWITFSKKTGATTDRGCGTEGAVEKFGNKFFEWLKIDPLHALAGGDICFSPPFGKQDEEMCLCKKDGCNKDSNTARASLGLHQKAASITCGDKDCPVMDLSKVIEGWKGFNTACYKKVNNNRLPLSRSKSANEEHCFSTEGIYDEKAIEAAKMTTKAGSVVGQRFGAFTFTSQSETPTSLDCASECLDPYGSGLWCCEACQEKGCSGGTGSHGGAGSSGRTDQDGDSSPANGDDSQTNAAAKKGNLFTWLLLVISVSVAGF